MARKLVLEHELLTVEEVAEQKTIILRREPKSASAEELVHAYQHALERGVAYRGWALVLDVRLAPGRNDDQFEGSVSQMRTYLDQLFAPIVTLVATPAGALQVQRLAREQGRIDNFVTYDEDEALRLCREH